MALSGTYDFSPEIADLIDEAYERAGVDSSALTSRHIRTAIRSINLMFSHWATKGVFQWKIDMQEVTLSEGIETYTMPSGSIDVFAMVYRKTSGTKTIDTPMTRISREEYLNIHEKESEGGIADQFFVDRQRSVPIIYLWPVPDNSTDKIVYYRLIRIQDAGSMSNTPDVPFYWFEAMASGLSARLALKFNVERYALLLSESKEMFQDAKDEDRDKAPTELVYRF